MNKLALIVPRHVAQSMLVARGMPRGRQGQVGMLRASSKPRVADEEVLAIYIIGLYSLHLKDLDAKTMDAEPTPGDEGSGGAVW